MLSEKRNRVVIENLILEIDGGLFAFKRVVGEKVIVKLLIGAEMAVRAAARSPVGKSRFLEKKARALRSDTDFEECLSAALDEDLSVKNLMNLRRH